MIADVRMLASRASSAALQTLAHRDDIGEQAVAPDDLLHGEAGGRRHRMAHIGVAVLEEAGAFGERLEDLLLSSTAPIG